MKVVLLKPMSKKAVPGLCTGGLSLLRVKADMSICLNRGNSNTVKSAYLHCNVCKVIM